MEEDGLYLVTAENGLHSAMLSNGKVAEAEAVVASPIELDRWNIEIEDWNEGDRVVNTEEKFGHVTKEVYYTTKKTVLKFPETKPVFWKDLPATSEQLAQLAGEAPSMAHVSGMGRYETEVELPADWNQKAQLQLDSAGGGSVMVWVNGEKVGAMHTRSLKIDVSDYLKPGKNTIQVEVASTLTNRMIQRGYKNIRSGWNDIHPSVQAYGMVGAKLVPYVKVKL
jgi:hypothetical protein